jgi:hypothetical protein
VIDGFYQTRFFFGNFYLFFKPRGDIPALLLVFVARERTMAATQNGDHSYFSTIPSCSRERGKDMSTFIHGEKKRCGCFDNRERRLLVSKHFYFPFSFTSFYLLWLCCFPPD